MLGPTWSVAWAALHLIVSGVMATIAFFELRVWWQFREQGDLKVTGLLCVSVSLTLLAGSVGLVFPVADVFRVVVPIRAVLIGMTVALFLLALDSRAHLPKVRLAAVVSLALPIIYSGLGLTTSLAYGFDSAAPWPQIRPLGNILVVASIVVLGAYTARSLVLLKGGQRHQLAVASLSVVAMLSIGIFVGRGVITEAMTTLWTLPVAILLAIWWSSRALTIQGSLVSAVAGLREAERQADHRARHDQLTGLPNRGVAADHLQYLLDGLDRRLMIIVSALKFTHLDELRSAEGQHRVDAFLRGAAQHLQYAQTNTVVVARLRENTFVVFTTISQEAAKLINGDMVVEGQVHQLKSTANFPPQVGIAVGIAVSGGSCNADDLLHRAEVAVNEAEHTQTVVQFYRPELREELIKRASMGRQLKTAIDRDEFEVHYQPVVEAGSLRRVEVECLVRWRYKGQLRQPLDWIPLAEQQGLMHEIGLGVLRTAVRDYASLRCPIAVNVSPGQFSDRSFVTQVLEVLQDLPAGAILLEITEGSITSNVHRACIALERLRAHGIRIALDDFGTEHSSLSRLVSLPFDVLKIDRSFITNILTPQGNAIVTAIQAMAHAIGKTTVAEGVETAEQLAAVQAIGCDRVQGFFTGRPSTLSDLLSSDLLPSDLLPSDLLPSSPDQPSPLP